MIDRDEIPAMGRNGILAHGLEWDSGFKKNARRARWRGGRASHLVGGDQTETAKEAKAIVVVRKEQLVLDVVANPKGSGGGIARRGEDGVEAHAITPTTGFKIEGDEIPA